MQIVIYKIFSEKDKYKILNKKTRKNNNLLNFI